MLPHAFDDLTQGIAHPFHGRKYAVAITRSYPHRLGQVATADRVGEMLDLTWFATKRPRNVTRDPPGDHAACRDRQRGQHEHENLERAADFPRRVSLCAVHLCTCLLATK